MDPSDSYWDERDLQGSRVLIEGVKTGSSKVVARIKDPHYNYVPPSEITLVVIANIFLSPSSNVYLIPDGHVLYRVNILKGQQIRELAMPSDQYYLQIADPKIASLDTAASVVTGLKDGATSITLKDRNINSDTAGLRQPTSDLVVAKPSYMRLLIEPGQDNWALQEGMIYIVNVALFDAYHHRMFSSPNLRLSVVFPKSHFQVLEATNNGTYHVVKTVKTGKVLLKGTLEGALRSDGTISKLSKPINLEQEIQIYPQLRITPPSIFLPWDQDLKPSYKVYPFAEGATGMYRWESLNPTFASVNYKPEVGSSSKCAVSIQGEGSTTLIVTDYNNHVFRKEIPIRVSEVLDMDIIPGILESAVGSSVYVQVAFYGSWDETNPKSKLRLFDDCSKVPLVVDVVEKNRALYTENSNEGIVAPNACRAVRFDCKSPGHSRVWISYVTPTGDVLNSTTVVSCFLNLKPVYPDGEGLIALGTSIEVAFEGGPRKWPIHSEGYFSRLTSLDENLFEITPVLDPYRYRKDLHVFRVLCKKLGQTRLDLEIGNAPSATLPNPASETLSFTVACANPVLLSLRPKMKKGDSCPLNLVTASKIPVSGLDTVEIEVTAKNEAGLTFLNISSLRLEWHVSDNNVGKLGTHRDFTEEVNGAGGFRRWNRNFVPLQPLKKEGELIVSVVANSFRKEVLSKEGISSRTDLGELKTEVVLSLVDRPQVVPSEATVFNHATSVLTIQIAKGSGHYHVTPQALESGIANITYLDGLKQVLVRPMVDGVVQLKVIDACVEFEPSTSPLPDAQSLIRVTDPKMIKVWCLDKIQLGQEVEVAIEVMDTSNQIIPSEYHRLLQIEADFGSDVVIVRSSEKQPNATHSFAVIRGEKIGRTGIVFKSTTSEQIYSKRIQSTELKLEVFPPLKIEPSILKLIPGAILEVVVSGGPQPDSIVEFSSVHEDIARVSKIGLVNAVSIGSTRLVARAVSLTSNHVYSEDEATIQVLPIQSFKLVAPSKQLLVGAAFPLTLVAFGPRNEILSPFNFGSADPFLKMTWSVSNGEVIQLRNVMSDSSIDYEGRSQFNIRCKGIRDGSAVVRVSVHVTDAPSSKSKQQLINNNPIHDNITIQVISELDLIQGGGSGRLLLSPGAEYKLRSTRDGVARVSYAIKSGINKIVLEKSGLTLRSLSNDASEAFLEMRSQESNGLVQVSSTLVQIQPVTYIMVTPEPSIHLKKESSLMFVPLGSTLKLFVNFFNMMGQRFNAISGKVNVRLNRFGIIGYSWTSTSDGNMTLSLSALKEGSTLIRVWIEGDQEASDIEDVIQVYVGQVITPRVYNVVVGDILCLSSPLVTPEGQPGVWSSSENEGFMFPSSNVVIVQKSGKMRIKQDLTSFSTYSNDMIVTGAKQLQIDAQGIAYLTNFMESPVLLPLSVTSEANDEPARIYSHGCSRGFLSGIELPFKCSLKFTSQSIYSAHDLMTCKPVFNEVSDRYELLITSNSSASKLNQELVSTIRSKIEISVEYNGLGHMSSSVVIKFLPAFHVHKREIILTNSKPLEYLTISGTESVVRDSLQISAINDETRKTVDIFPMEIISIADQVVGTKIPIQLKGKLDSLWQTSNDPKHQLQMRVYSSVTRQTEIVSVSIQWVLDSSSSCIKLTRPSLYDSRSSVEIIVDLILLPCQFLSEYYQQLISISCLMLVLLVTYQFFKKSKQLSYKQTAPDCQPSFTHFNTSRDSQFVSSPRATSSYNDASFGARTPLKFATTPTPRVTSPGSSGDNSPVRGSPPGRHLWTRPR